MMTTAQLAQRLAQEMWGVDFSALTMTQKEKLRDGINLALDEFGSLLPAHRKQRGAPFVVDEPRTISVNVTAGSTAITVATGLPFGFYAAASDLVGRGLVLASSPSLNRLLSSTALLLPYLGTTGAVAGTLYADGVPLPARVEQLAGEVTFLKEGQATPLPLTHRNDFPFTAAYTNGTTITGEPSVWWLEPFGGADAQDVRMVLRVWPLPSVRGILMVPLSRFVAAVTLSDMHITPRELPVDEIEQGYLVSLCTPHLLGSSGLREGLSPANIQTMAGLTRSMLRTRANHNPSGQPNRCGTPAGF